MNLTIDSSVFVSALNEADPSFEESLRTLDAINARNDQVTIPTLVVMEVATALARVKLLPTREDWDVFLYPLVLLPMDRSFTLGFIDFIQTRQLNLKAGDTIIVYTALLTDSSLITFDQQMLAQGSKYVRTLTPQQYIDTDGIS